MKQFHLMIHKDLRDHINRLNAERSRDPNGDAAKEFNAVIQAMKALQEGRESEYTGKQLGYGPRSHDLSDCAELKVPVFEEFKPNGYPMGPSHRLTYREFEPLPKVEDGRVVPDADALPYRQAVAFEHRSNDPAGVTGDRLGRDRGIPERELQGLGGGRPSEGPQQPGAQTTPHRVPLPPDLIAAANALRGTAPAAGAVNAPSAAGDTAANRAPGTGWGQTRDRSD